MESLDQGTEFSAGSGMPGWAVLGAMGPHTSRRMNGAQSGLEQTLGGTLLPSSNPLFHSPPYTPSPRDTDTFFPRWRHRQRFQSKFRQRRLSLATGGSAAAGDLPSPACYAAPRCGGSTWGDQAQGHAQNLHDSCVHLSGVWCVTGKRMSQILRDRPGGDLVVLGKFVKPKFGAGQKEE